MAAGVYAIITNTHTIRLLMTLLVTVSPLLTHSQAGAAEDPKHVLTLPERLITMISASGGDGSTGPGKLFAVTRTETRDESQKRFLQALQHGTDGALKAGDRRPLDPAVVAYSECSDGSAGGTLLLGLTGGSVRELLTGKILVEHPSLFAHRARDLFPKIPVCFDLFGDERQALVIPTLTGVTVFRWNAKAKRYEKNDDIDVRADSRFSWQVTGQAPDGVGRQHASVSFDFPDNFITDFDGDGRRDMCFAYGESIQCVLQKKEGGYSGAGRSRFNFDILSSTEKDDTSVRIRNRMLDIDGDKLADLVIQKTIWNLTGMETTLYIYKNKPGTGYKGAPDQVIRRSGYFAYHDFIDITGDGLPELISPVADMSFTDMVRILVSRSVSIDIVVYANNKGRYSDKARSVYAHSYPVNFRNAASLSSALPLWNVDLGPQGEKGKGAVGIFFPEKEKVAALQFAAKSEPDASVLWSKDAELGDIMTVIDLDGDGIDEVYTGSPRDTARAKKIMRISMKP